MRPKNHQFPWLNFLRFPYFRLFWIDSYGDTVDIYDESDFDLYGDYYYDAIMCISERRSAVPSAVATPEAPATPARTNQKWATYSKRVETATENPLRELRFNIGRTYVDSSWS